MQTRLDFLFEMNIYYGSSQMIKETDETSQVLHLSS